MYCMWETCGEKSHFCPRLLIVPAIQPARLKQQTSLLVEHFEQPAAFLRSLYYLLDFYSDRAVRPGQSGKPKSLTPAFNVRTPVLRHLLLALEPLAENNPAAGLALCDALWEQNYLEYRLLAGMLLGKIPLTSSDAVLQRINSWIGTDLEEILTTALLTNGLVRLRQEYPQKVIHFTKGWLEEPDIFYQQLGLRLLSSIIRDPEFQNLPAFFHLLQPFVIKAHPSLRPDLLDAIEILAVRSPQETAYFLRQSLEMPDNPDTALIIRQSLHKFSDDIQSNLRLQMRERERKLGGI